MDRNCSRFVNVIKYIRESLMHGDLFKVDDAMLIILLIVGLCNNNNFRYLILEARVDIMAVCWYHVH